MEETARRAPSLEEALTLARANRAFAVRQSGDRVLFTYLHADPAAFADPLARELRGIVYRVDGTLLSRPFHKFFNYKEPPHGLTAEAFQGPALLAEKLDGYLLQVFLDEDELVFASRHSLRPPLVGSLAKRLWTEAHEEAARRLLRQTPLTLLFEVLDPKAPVLVRYPHPRLVLLAARRLDTGEYLLPGVNLDWPLETAVWEERFLDPEAFAREVSEEEGLEGFVAYLPAANEFAKFKAGWVFRLTRFLASPEARFVEAYAADRLDDLLAALAERKDLQEAVLRARTHLDRVYEEAVALGLALRGLPRKEAWERVQAEAAPLGLLAGPFAEAAMAAYGGGDSRRKYRQGLLTRGRGVEFTRELGVFPRVGGELLG